MSTIGATANPNQGTEQQPRTKTSVAEQPDASWANGVLVVPLLWLTVMGYQALMLALKVVNRERGARQEFGLV